MKHSETLSFPMLWTAEECAAFLKIHPVTLRKKARAHEVPAIRFGTRGWRFEENTIREWLAAGCPKMDQQPNLFEVTTGA